MAHEKTYVICENMCMEESLTKEEIHERILKNSGVPENGIIKFAGNEIPEGFEEYNPIEVSHGEWNDNLRYVALRNLKAGEIYKISMSYNHRSDWSTVYRSTFLGYISMNVGLTGENAVLRPKLDLIVNYHDMDSSADSNLVVVCERATTEININEYNDNKVIYLNYSNCEISDIEINIERIV